MNRDGSLIEQLEAISQEFAVDYLGYRWLNRNIVLYLTRQSRDALVAELRNTQRAFVNGESFTPEDVGYNCAIEDAIALVRKRFYGDAAGAEFNIHGSKPSEHIPQQCEENSTGDQNTQLTADALVAELEACKAQYSALGRQKDVELWNDAVDQAIALVRKRFYGEGSTGNAHLTSQDVLATSPPLTADARCVCLWSPVRGRLLNNCPLHSDETQLNQKEGGE